MPSARQLRNFWIPAAVLLCVFWGRLFLAIFHEWSFPFGGKWQIVVSRWYDVVALPVFVILALAALALEERRVAARPKGMRYVSSVPLVLLFLGTAYGSAFGFTFPVVVSVLLYGVFYAIRGAIELMRRS